MNMRLAHDEITLAHGGNTVRLRPSLRAATKLERSHDGFLNLERHIFDFHFGTIREVIVTAATDRQEAAAFLAHLDTVPLKQIADCTILPIITLCASFLPAPDKDSEPAANTGKPVAWVDFYAALYERATGWLGWTPEAAWNATPTEIDRAYTARIEMLKAIHGSGEPDQPAHDPRKEVTEQEARTGLAQLRANAQRGKR